MAKIVADAQKTFGGIDILITAAGVNKPGPIVQQPLEEWEMIMDANVKGTYLFCKEVGKVMIAQGRGGKVILVGLARPFGHGQLLGLQSLQRRHPFIGQNFGMRMGTAQNQCQRHRSHCLPDRLDSMDV